MKPLNAKAALKWFIINLPEVIAGVAVVFAVSLTSVNTFTRYFLHFTINGTDEYVCIAFAWLIFLGAAAGYRRNMHYGIDLLVNRLPQKGRALCSLIARAMTVLIFLVLTYLSYVLYANVGTKILPATRISYRVVDASMLMGFALMAIYSIIFLVQDIRTMIKKDSKQGGEAI